MCSVISAFLLLSVKKCQTVFCHKIKYRAREEVVNDNGLETGKVDDIIMGLVKGHGKLARLGHPSGRNHTNNFSP